jgi:hypothetical protein
VRGGSFRQGNDRIQEKGALRMFDPNRPWFSP